VIVVGIVPCGGDEVWDRLGVAKGRVEVEPLGRVVGREGGQEEVLVEVGPPGGHRFLARYSGAARGDEGVKAAVERQNVVLVDSPVGPPLHLLHLSRAA
jgi:hypothetical protein